ncbi:MAG TPA: hypothetical protein VN456_08790 [Desulfosporosinus sp.]|nr:hypothetical protein [Desulfosporosinus sp.]
MFTAEKTTRRRQFESQLDGLEETDLIIMAATEKGIKEAKGAEGNCITANRVSIFHSHFWGLNWNNATDVLAG